MGSSAPLGTLLIALWFAIPPRLLASLAASVRTGGVGDDAVRRHFTACRHYNVYT